MNKPVAASEITNMNRRELLKSGAAGLFVYFAFSALPKHAEAAPSDTDPRIGAYLRIANDGTSANNYADYSVTILIGSTEMGQGIMTAMAQLVAEELALDPARWTKQITVLHETEAHRALDANRFGKTTYASGNFTYGSQSTGGSKAIMNWSNSIRQAAAIARDLLIQAYKAKNPNATNVTVLNGAVTGSDGIEYYGTLASLAATLTPTASSTLTPTKFFIGKDLPRTDIPAKVNGSAIFGLDVIPNNDLDNHLFASVVHAPTLKGTANIARIPTSLNGATAVVPLLAEGSTTEYNAIAVVASNTWSAMKLADGLLSSTSSIWNSTDPALASAMEWTSTTNTNSVVSVGQNLARVSVIPSNTNLQLMTPSTTVPSQLPDPNKFDAVYQLPFLAHACMEVLNCTVLLTSSGDTIINCEIWAPTQSQTTAVTKVAALLNIDRSLIKLHTTYLGGGLGRKLEVDFILQAVQVAKSVPNKAVKVVWRRTQDFKNDRYRPAAFIRVQATTTVGKEISQFVYRNVSSSVKAQKGTVADTLTPDFKTYDTGAVAGATGSFSASTSSSMTYTPHYDGLPASKVRVEHVPHPSPVPVGYWRSVGESYNIFAVESAIDEIAYKVAYKVSSTGATITKVDPLAYRRNVLLSDSTTSGKRARCVIDKVIAMSGWNTAPSRGRARGAAFMNGFGSMIAMVVDIGTDSLGKIVVKNVYCAVDCGTAVSPANIRAQIEGGFIHGFSAAMWGEVKPTANGTVPISNFNSYRVAKLADAPLVTVAIAGVDFAPGVAGAAIGGIGEVGVPCVAPAIANAYFALKGVRLRSLPFYPNSTMGEL